MLNFPGWVTKVFGFLVGGASGTWLHGNSGPHASVPAAAAALGAILQKDSETRSITSTGTASSISEDRGSVISATPVVAAGGFNTPTEAVSMVGGTAAGVTLAPPQSLCALPGWDFFFPLLFHPHVIHTPLYHLRADTALFAQVSNQLYFLVSALFPAFISSSRWDAFVAQHDSADIVEMLGAIALASAPPPHLFAAASFHQTAIY